VRPLALLLLLLACAPKLCPPPEKLLSNLLNPPPERVTLYGYLKAGPLKTPFVLIREDGRELLRTAFTGLTLKGRSVCLDGACLELPVSPTELLYGYLPGRYRVVSCLAGRAVLENEKGVRLYLKDGRLEELRWRDVRVLFSERAPEGFFKQLTVVYKDLKLKIEVEGVRDEEA